MKDLSEHLLRSIEKRFKIHKHAKEWYGLSCPFCGDSPNPNTYHLFIRLPANDDIYAIKCFQPKCDVSGILKRKHLMTLGIHDIDIWEAIDKLELINIKYESINIDGIILPLKPKENVKAYYEWRTQKELTEEVIIKESIIVDIVEFYNLNFDRIHFLDLEYYIYNNNVDNIIGFLTKNRNQIFIRNFNENAKKPHMKISLLSEEKAVISKDWYEINNNHSIYKEDNNIIHSEGGFDAVNARHILGGINGLYIAYGSYNSFKTLFPYVAKKHYNPNHIFMLDKDITDMSLKSLIKKNSYMCEGKNFMCRNTKGKDFGNLSEPHELLIKDL